MTQRCVALFEDWDNGEAPVLMARVWVDPREAFAPLAEKTSTNIMPIAFVVERSGIATHVGVADEHGDFFLYAPLERRAHLSRGNDCEFAPGSVSLNFTGALVARVVERLLFGEAS